MNLHEVEPLSTDSCSQCGETRQLFGEYGTDEPLCAVCMEDRHGEEFLEWIVIDVVYDNYEVHEPEILFDWGYGIQVGFELKQAEMPASRRPSETDLIRFQKTGSNRATIYYNEGRDITKLGTVIAKNWAKHADELLYPD